MFYAKNALDKAISVGGNDNAGVCTLLWEDCRWGFEGFRFYKIYAFLVKFWFQFLLKRFLMTE